MVVTRSKTKSNLGAKAIEARPTIIPRNDDRRGLSKRAKRSATTAKRKDSKAAVKSKIICIASYNATATLGTIHPARETGTQGVSAKIAVVATTAFLNLPPELRNEIYSYALVEDIPIHVGHSRPYLREPGMLATNRQIRSEALPIWYSENAFVIVGSSPAVKFLRSLASEELCCLRKLLVSVTNISTASYARERMSKMMQEFGRGGLRRQVIHFEINAVGHVQWMNLDQLAKVSD